MSCIFEHLWMESTMNSGVRGRRMAKQKRKDSQVTKKKNKKLKKAVAREMPLAPAAPPGTEGAPAEAFENVWCLQHLDGGAVPCSERPLSPGQPLSLSSRSSLTSGRALLEARARVCLSTGTGSSSGSSAGHRARHPRPTALAASLLARPSRSLG
ncbi:uncharacterized protein C7orf50 homolog isoform X5 [Lagenorhynchus albirostris]|uniref:uncharacterized protein C7orf50 homolog isoform X5 n=1 Tax=Lagenorhynchus albirostris TaxID=27610 RepID=UPI0028E361AD|nr:uncharacterized protein C7orf50 homolog isoform X5 [Lagenorhynchus albirostris]